jgi:RNA polymerase sigma-70 factor (ECF subfamily)
LADYDDHAFERAIAEWRPLPTPEDIVLSEEQRDGLIAAVDGLEPELRATIILADLEELPQREVATMLDIPEGTVASRLFRARRKLRSALEATAGSARGWRAG